VPVIARNRKIRSRTVSKGRQGNSNGW